MLMLGSDFSFNNIVPFSNGNFSLMMRLTSLFVMAIRKKWCCILWADPGFLQKSSAQSIRYDKCLFKHALELSVCPRNELIYCGSFILLLYCCCCCLKTGIWWTTVWTVSWWREIFQTQVRSSCAMTNPRTVLLAMTVCVHPLWHCFKCVWSFLFSQCGTWGRWLLQSLAWPLPSISSFLLPSSSPSLYSIFILFFCQ